jgi:hypothetical protein
MTRRQCQECVELRQRLARVEAELGYALEVARTRRPAGQEWRQRVGALLGRPWI